MNKSIKILLAVFAILIAVYFLFFRTGDKVSTDKLDAKLFVADSSKIDKIEIVKNGETVVLEKSNNIWKITKPIDYPADTTNIYLMLKDLKNFTIEMLHLKIRLSSTIILIQLTIQKFQLTRKENFLVHLFLEKPKQVITHLFKSLMITEYYWLQI